MVPPLLTANHRRGGLKTNMTHRVSVWLCCSSAMALCVLWGASADEQVSILPGASLSDWLNTDDSATVSPTHRSSEGAPAGTAIGTEVVSTRAVHSVFIRTPATAASPTRAGPSILPPEDLPGSSSPAFSTTEAMVTMAATQPATLTPTLSSTPGMKLDQPPHQPPISPAGRPTSPPAPPSLGDGPGDRQGGEEEEEEGVRVETVPEEGGREPVCDFDPCVHLQRPCPEEKEVKGWNCRCPGLTSDPSVAPGPVVALAITRVWPRGAGVRWCAPYSVLSAFLVWVLRQDGSAVSNSSVSLLARQTSVFGLEAGHTYSVCVSAQNGEGVSHRRCVPVSTPQDAEAMALYALIGGCATLLVLVVVLSLCLYGQCKQGQGPGTPTLLTPTIQTLHDPQLTSLVSISNPAYASVDEQTAPSCGDTRYTHRAQAKKPANLSKR